MAQKQLEEEWLQMKIMTVVKKGCFVLLNLAQTGTGGLTLVCNHRESPSTLVELSA